MSKYFFVYCDSGVFIKAPSEERAVEIFENKFSERSRKHSCVYAKEQTVEDIYNLNHMGCQNWPNCDIAGCGNGRTFVSYEEWR